MKYLSLTSLYHRKKSIPFWILFHRDNFNKCNSDSDIVVPLIRSPFPLYGDCGFSLPGMTEEIQTEMVFLLGEIPALVPPKGKGYAMEYQQYSFSFSFRGI